MKRTIAAGVLVTAAALTGVVALSGTASAHVNSVTATCEAGVTVTASKYVDDANPAHVNTASVKVDGVQKAGSSDFGSTFNAAVPNPDKTTTHTWSVDITAWDGIGVVHQTGSLPACETPPTTTTTAPPTTTTQPAPTHVVVPPAPPAPKPVAIVAPAHFTG